MIYPTYAPKTLAFKGVLDDYRQGKKNLEKKEEKITLEEQYEKDYQSRQVQDTLIYTYVTKIAGEPFRAFVGKEVLQSISEYIGELTAQNKLSSNSNSPSCSLVNFLGEVASVPEYLGVVDVVNSLEKARLIRLNGSLESTWELDLQITGLGKYVLNKLTTEKK